jgi:hypothetical protein
MLVAAMLPAAAPPRAKPAAAVSDSSIEQNIRGRFAKSKIAEDKFTVRVQGGVAIVEGRTNVIQRKGVATRLAKAGGARSVDNRIRIADDARTKAAEKLRELRPATPPQARSKPVTAAPAKPAAAELAKPASPDAMALETKPIPRAIVKH